MNGVPYIKINGTNYVWIDGCSFHSRASAPDIEVEGGENIIIENTKHGLREPKKARLKPGRNASLRGSVAALAGIIGSTISLGNGGLDLLGKIERLRGE